MTNPLKLRGRIVLKLSVRQKRGSTSVREQTQLCTVLLPEKVVHLAHDLDIMDVLSHTLVYSLPVSPTFQIKRTLLTI